MLKYFLFYFWVLLLFIYCAGLGVKMGVDVEFNTFSVLVPKKKTITCDISRIIWAIHDFKDFLFLSLTFY